jgi:hypothetical protein
MSLPWSQDINLSQQSRCLSSSEDGNRSSFRNVVFLSSNSLESGRWTKSENPLILCVVHHPQNPIESTHLSLCFIIYPQYEIRFEKEVTGINKNYILCHILMLHTIGRFDTDANWGLYWTDSEEN